MMHVLEVYYSVRQWMNFEHRLRYMSKLWTNRPVPMLVWLNSVAYCRGEAKTSTVTQLQIQSTPWNHKPLLVFNAALTLNHITSPVHVCVRLQRRMLGLYYMSAIHKMWIFDAWKNEEGVATVACHVSREIRSAPFYCDDRTVFLRQSQHRHLAIAVNTGRQCHCQWLDCHVS